MPRAEVGQQQEAVLDRALEHARRVDADLLQHRGDAQVGPHVLPAGRSVHDDQRGCGRRASRGNSAGSWRRPKRAQSEAREAQAALQPVAQGLQARVSRGARGAAFRHVDQGEPRLIGRCGGPRAIIIVRMPAPSVPAASGHCLRIALRGLRAAVGARWRAPPRRRTRRGRTAGQAGGSCRHGSDRSTDRDAAAGRPERRSHRGHQRHRRAGPRRRRDPERQRDHPHGTAAARRPTRPS